MRTDSKTFVWLDLSRYQQQGGGVVCNTLLWHGHSQCPRWPSTKCGKCPLTMVIYCGLSGRDLHGPTSPSVRQF